MIKPRNLILALAAWLIWAGVAYALFRHAEFHQPDLNRHVSVLLAILWPFVLGWHLIAHHWITLIVSYLFLGALWGAIDHFLDALGTGVRFWSATLALYVVFFAFCWPFLLYDRLRYGR